MSNDITDVAARFERATAEFGRLTDSMRSSEFDDADHATIEHAIQVGGQEALRLLFEASLARRAAQQPRRDVAGSDGRRRTHHRCATRTIASLFGPVEVARDRVGARNTSALVPTDAVLNLPEDRFTFGVRERVVAEAIRGSYDAAVQAVSSTTGAPVAKRQAEELVQAAAVDFDGFYEQPDDGATATAASKEILVITVDGKGIVMRPDGLRADTRRRAEQGSHKLKGRLSKGERKNRKRIAAVAAVYDLAAVPRTPSEVLGELDRTAVAPRPRATNKRVWASVEKTPHAVVDEVFGEAARRDPGHARRWVVLVDGNDTQIKATRAAAAVAGVAVTLVLDLIHVTEYLWKAAWDVFKEGDPAGEAWVRKYLAMVLDGRASIAAAAIRRSATTRKITRRYNIDRAAAYLLRHVDMLRYDQYLRDGLPIATGVIEGACRHLVKDRMDITGARWGLAGAEALLRLRSLQVSGDLERYWEFHRQRELERNHVACYDPAARATWLAQSAA